MVDGPREMKYLYECLKEIVMSESSRPTEKQIHRTLEAKQVVCLASGYCDTTESVWVKNFTELPDDESGMWQLGYPEFGNWKSFGEIKDALAKEIEGKFPAKAFPFLRLGKITLYGRNDEDKEYLLEMGDFDVEDMADG